MAQGAVLEQVHAVSIIRQTRMCACGQEFKVRSESGAEQCWPCHLATVEADYLAHAERHAAAMVEYGAAHADEDPFVNRWGQDLSVGLTHTGKQPHRAVKP